MTAVWKCKHTILQSRVRSQELIKSKSIRWMKMLGVLISQVHPLKTPWKKTCFYFVFIRWRKWFISILQAITRWWTEHQRNGINNKLEYHIWLHNKNTGTFSWIKVFLSL
ncbi:hypothetical protein ANCCAN_01599 [Ancylostoma caninum]|uniref:Uncharacterized protein n=1 Tax=Ancylostoma caninum TaxID=29170 RepID=A0A368H966_ANCCA|nr:hypothetical protein ANCCAN_01599 [Ancylostoma caninum]